MAETQRTNHTVYIENRKGIAFTGIIDVNGFDEQTVTLKSDLGGIIIKGSDLQITELSLDKGDVKISGTINSMQYTGSADSKGVFSKIFK